MAICVSGLHMTRWPAVLALDMGGWRGSRLCASYRAGGDDGDAIIEASAIAWHSIV